MDKKILTHRFAKGLSLLFIAALAVGLALGLTMPFAVATPVGADPGTIQVDIKDLGCVMGTGQPDPYACVYCNIQDAIDDATSGDIINVAAGTYVENIILKDEVQLFGAGALVTTIDGGGSGSVVTAVNVGPDTVLDGFRITNGNPWDGGGGIHIEHGELVVSNNVISGNTVASPAMGGSGGIYAWYSSPVIRDNTVENNTAGAIAIHYTSSAIVTDNLVTQNEGGILVADGSFGNISGNIVSNNSGGIAIITDSGVVSNNQVIGNLGEGNFYAISVSGGPINVSGNLVCDNHPTGLYGAGICIWGGSNATVVNNVITGNTGQWDGGGIYVTQSSPLLINNPVIDNNPKGIVGVYCTPAAVNCIVWGNGDDLDGCTATYSDISDGDPGEGNISADPMFVDPVGGDYRLQAGSPCIDTGTNEGAPSEDIEGNPRPIDGDGDSSAITDMGAYEKQPPVGGIVGPVTLSEPGTASDQAPGGATGHTAVALWLGLAFILAIGGGVLALRRRR